ncbi:hypothetical protein NDU88_001751 [Pleurodeles waltl]|uniref:Uncharacterized protein n=1 Tax=Pleurodeles waltl TaxID=8319 RepID=A0AAV7RAT0_PLEWA|nr:hypothetical protein NDU88_001751 [Pleurodeles waltl]
MGGDVGAESVEFDPLRFNLLSWRSLQKDAASVDKSAPSCEAGRPHSRLIKVNEWARAHPGPVAGRCRASYGIQIKRNILSPSGVDIRPGQATAPQAEAPSNDPGCNSLVPGSSSPPLQLGSRAIQEGAPTSPEHAPPSGSPTVPVTTGPPRTTSGCGGSHHAPRPGLPVL